MQSIMQRTKIFIVTWLAKGYHNSTNKNPHIEYFTILLHVHLTTLYLQGPFKPVAMYHASYNMP